MLSRRDFLDRAAKYAVGGFTAAAMLESLKPDYALAHHGFHNDTTPRYDEAAAKVAWQRTLAFFQKYLTA